MSQLAWAIWHLQRLSQRQWIELNARLSKIVRPQPRRANLVMFHIGRSGSTVLADLLAQHPQIFWDGEIYEALFRRMEKSGQVIQAASLPLDPIGVLYQQRAKTGRAFYGCEVKFFHLQLLGVPLQDFSEQLRRLRFTYLVLERKNLLRKIVSSLVAHQTTHYHQPPQVKSILTPIQLDLDHIQLDRATRPLIAYLQDYAESFRTLRALLPQPAVLWLTYEEDILTNPWLGYQRVCRFLNIAPHPVRLHYGKTNPFALQDIVINFQELVSYLQGTPFEWMLFD